MRNPYFLNHFPIPQHKYTHKIPTIPLHSISTKHDLCGNKANKPILESEPLSIIKEKKKFNKQRRTDNIHLRNEKTVH